MPHEPHIWLAFYALATAMTSWQYMSFMADSPVSLYDYRVCN